jgi:hypothetical protein
MAFHILFSERVYHLARRKGIPPQRSRAQRNVISNSALLTFHEESIAAEQEEKQPKCPDDAYVFYVLTEGQLNGKKGNVFFTRVRLGGAHSIRT